MVWVGPNGGTIYVIIIGLAGLFIYLGQISHYRALMHGPI